MDGSMVTTVLTTLSTRNELAEDEAPLCDLLFSEPQDSPWWAPNEYLLGCLWGPGLKASWVALVFIMTPSVSHAHIAI